MIQVLIAAGCDWVCLHHSLLELHGATLWKCFSASRNYGDVLEDHHFDFIVIYVFYVFYFTLGLKISSSSASRTLTVL